jgi:signal transduction histidine kinase
MSPTRPRLPVPRLSLRWRVAVAFGLGSLIVTGALCAITWTLASGYMIRQRELTATYQTEVNVRLVDASLRTSADGLNDLLSGLASESDSTVLLERPVGWLISGRQITPSALPDRFLDVALSGVPARQRLFVDGVPVLAVTMPVGNDRLAYIELVPLNQLDRTLRFISSVLAAGVLLSTVLATAFGFWASRRALRPLSELTEAAGRVAAGDLKARLPTHEDPDLAHLAVTFNRTADALEDRVRRDARFAGDISHELRSPLTTMANAAAVLERRRHEFTGTGRQALDLLLSEVSRFQRMVVDLLEISRDGERPNDADIDVVDLAALVGNVAEGRRDGGPTLELSEQPALVLGDRRRLDRVVANLLDNADTYGGGAVRVGVERAGGLVRLEIDDAGPGVPVELRERIFERFARGMWANRRGGGGGSGLGLALVAQHVRRHHGRAWVEDRPGGGARFVVELPEAGG